ncbi:MAG: hypothetical protein WD070_12270 [Pirellulaceae bacterium]
MTTDLFRVRERALEYEFFHKVDEELWQRLREQLEFDQRRRALADATGITDEALLAELVELDISSESIFALSLFPLVWLAWTDGRIAPEERQVILEAAHASGHEQGTASYQLIETWLDHKPDEKLETAWKDYVRSVCATISPAASQSLKEDVLHRAGQLVGALRVRYGFHNIESQQDKILEEIERAFTVR